jgi:hypothetical protein
VTVELVASSAGLDNYPTDMLDVPQSGQQSREQSRTSAFLPLVSSGFDDDECSAQMPAFRKPSSDETMGQLLLAWAFVSGVSEVVA